MTLDELQRELSAKSWRLRLFPGCTREALRGVLHVWSVTPHRDHKLRSSATEAIRDLSPGRGLGSIWIIIIIEVLKILIPILIDWLWGNDKRGLIVQRLGAEERATK